MKVSTSTQGNILVIETYMCSFEMCVTTTTTWPTTRECTEYKGRLFLLTGRVLTDDVD